MKLKNLIIIILLLILILIYYYNFELQFNDMEEKLLKFIKFNKKKKENKENKTYLDSIAKYAYLIRKGFIDHIYYNKEIKNPKISFITPVFNKEKYLESLILSIQHQYVEEFEIIFIDDCSTDNSFKIINEFSKKDCRIKFVKNKKNKGTLYSRSQGAIKSKGEYIIFIDSDDLVLQEGLNNSYNYIQKTKLSMVQFNSIYQKEKKFRLNMNYYKYDIIIRQPILSYIFYYNERTKKGNELNTALWDKLINRQTVIKAVNFIGEDYYNEEIKIENDVVLLFSIFQIADSYQYINETGYLYVFSNNDSITNSWKIPDIASSVIHGVFVNIKFLYEKTKNFYLYKLFAIYKLQQSYKRYNICFEKAEKEFNFMKKVLKILFNSPYISHNDKKIIQNITLSIYLLYQHQ